MSQSTATTISPSPVLSPTQTLRDLIEDSSCGMATPAELHDALTLLEQTMHQARTFPSVDIEVAA